MSENANLFAIFRTEVPSTFGQRLEKVSRMQSFSLSFCEEFCRVRRKVVDSIPEIAITFSRDSCCFFPRYFDHRRNLVTAVKMAVMLAVKWQCPQLAPSLSPALSQVLSQVLSQDEEKDASIDAKDATSSSKVATLDEEAANLADNGRNSVIRKQRQELHKELQ